MKTEAKEQELFKIVCGKCNFIIAMTDRAEIMVKNKDTYFYVRGGIVTIICRGCGAPNYCCDEKFEAANPAEAASVKGIVNIVEAKFVRWLRRPPFEEGSIKG
jgi:hypothetical protein